MGTTLKPGTVMIAVPKEGVPRSECFVCNGPNKDPKGAFLVGVVAGIRYLQDPTIRPKLCIEHETTLRENLAAMGASQDPEVLNKLGIDFKIAGAGEA